MKPKHGERWKVADGKPSKYGLVLPPCAILTEGGATVVGEARDEDEAEGIVRMHNRAVERAVSFALTNFHALTVKTLGGG